jgi:hypothetical protein
VVTTGFVLGRPLANTWRSYDDAVNGEHAQAKLVSKEEGRSLMLSLRSDTTEARSCIAKASSAVFENAEIGDVFDVLLKPDSPGECNLASTVSAAPLIVGAFLGMIVVAIALIFGLGLFLSRSYANVPTLTTRFAPGSPQLPCTLCGQPMREGYIVPMGGLHWRDADQAIGLPLVVGGLPGTVGWKGRPRLHAFRCESCRVVALKHGKN